VKDVTSTSFGLVIAYLLPGLAGLYSLSFWFPRIAELFAKFGSAESNVGLFLLVILTSIIISLQISVIRWVVFELCLCGKYRLAAQDLVNLANKDTHTAFRTLVDEQYRYHQFWGGMAIVQPYLFFGWLCGAPINGLFQSVAYWGLALAVETATIFAAITAWKRYIDRATTLLRGSQDAQRNRTTQESSERRTKGQGSEEERTGEESREASAGEETCDEEEEVI
jgi:hypothetical protein